MKLADVAPRLAEARDQRLEELRIAEWNRLAYTRQDRAPILPGETSMPLTYEQFLKATQDIFK